MRIQPLKKIFYSAITYSMWFIFLSFDCNFKTYCKCLIQHIPKVSSIKKNTNEQSGKISKSITELNQIWKIVLTQKHEIWNFNAMSTLYFKWKQEKNFEVMENIRKLKFGGVMGKDYIIPQESNKLLHIFK